jgi:hypothetical protein
MVEHDDNAASLNRWPAYWLPAHIYACRVLGGTVFLDLRRNRYLGVGETETQVLRRHVANWQDTGPTLERASLDEAAAACILDALSGLALLQPRGKRLRPFSPTSIRLHEARLGLDTFQASSRPIRMLDLWRFVRSCFWAYYVLHTSSLYGVACAVEDFGRVGNPISPSADPIQIRRCVQIFRRLRPYAFAAHGRCLFQALALARFLQYYRVPALWIIGVRVRPWAAHSWVQQGDLILDGTPESVREYTPILAVRT